MAAKVLIVEDELLVALEMEAIVEEQGHSAIGIATTESEVLDILEEEEPDVALVDLHLADGVTGPRIGQRLAKSGVSVIFVTANPRMLADGIPGALGVAEKPTDEETISEIVSYAVAHRAGAASAPPASLRPFRR